MKKILYIIAGLLAVPFFVVAAAPIFTVNQGGTGIGSAADGALIMGNSTLRFTTLATSTGGTVLQTSFTTGRPSWVATSTLGLSTSLVGTQGQVAYFSGTNTTVGTSSIFIATNGNVGIGTTTPGSLLSLVGLANFTTATSTFYSTGGVNLAGGCFAVAGICLPTAASITSAYPFPLTGNATSTLTQFNGGLTAYASSTIGGGAQNSGLTILGGSTTTLNANFMSNIVISTSSPVGVITGMLQIEQSIGGTDAIVIRNKGVGANPLVRIFVTTPVAAASADLNINPGNGNGRLNIDGYAVRTTRFETNGSSLVVSAANTPLALDGSTFSYTTNVNQTVAYSAGSSADTIIRGYGGANGQQVQILGGVPTGGTGGNVIITASAGTGSNSNGGNIVLTAGNASGTGIPGNVGIASSTPWGKLSILGSGSGTTTQLFVVASSTATNTFTAFRIDNKGHIFASSTNPVLSSCGTGPTMVGSDHHGTVTAGATANGCTITFGIPYPSAPTCVISNQSMSVINAMTYAVSASAITITETGLGGALFDYICYGNSLN